METRRMQKKNNIHAEQSEAGIFFEKIWNKGPKIHCLAIERFFLLKSANHISRFGLCKDVNLKTIENGISHS